MAVGVGSREGVFGILRNVRSIRIGIDIADADSGSAIQNGAPLGVDVELLSDPETVIFGIGVVWIAVVVDICRLALVIIRRDRFSIQHVRLVE